MTKKRKMSLPEFIKRFGTEKQCREHLFALRWPNGFICPKCGGAPRVRIDEREISVQAVQTSGKCNCWYNYASHSCTADQMVPGDVFHDKR